MYLFLWIFQEDEARDKAARIEHAEKRLATLTLELKVGHYDIPLHYSE